MSSSSSCHQSSHLCHHPAIIINLSSLCISLLDPNARYWAAMCANVWSGIKPSAFIMSHPVVGCLCNWIFYCPTVPAAIAQKQRCSCIVVMIVQLPCLQSPVWLLHFHSVRGLPIQSASLVLIMYHTRKTVNTVQLQLPFSKDIRKIWTATALPVGVILNWMLTSYFVWPTFLRCWLVLVRITLKSWIYRLCVEEM